MRAEGISFDAFSVCTGLAHTPHRPEPLPHSNETRRPQREAVSPENGFSTLPYTVIVPPSIRPRPTVTSISPHQQTSFGNHGPAIHIVSLLSALWIAPPKGVLADAFLLVLASASMLRGEAGEVKPSR